MKVSMDMPPEPPPPIPPIVPPSVLPPVPGTPPTIVVAPASATLRRGEPALPVITPVQPPPASVPPKPTISHPFPWGVVVGLFVFLIVVGGGVAGWMWANGNAVEIDDQPLGTTLLVKRLVVNSPKGGYFVVQGNTGLPGGQLVTSSALLPPGVYTDFGINFSTTTADGTPIERGSYLYGILYGETDGEPLLTLKDKQLKDFFGRYVIRRFRVR